MDAQYGMSFAFNFFEAPAAIVPDVRKDAASGVALSEAVTTVRVPADTATVAAATSSAPFAGGLRALTLVEPAPLVVADAYEGGGAVWECTSDVVSWLDGSAADARLAPTGRTVLDLGCGAALLGAWAAARGAAAIVCQDLNAGVLADISAPTLAVNGALSGACQVALLAGSWQALAAELESGRCSSGIDGGSSDGAVEWWRGALGGGRIDLVLASEVLYRPAQYAVLSRVLMHCLAPTGVAVIGTKRMYFGAALGGGTDAFLAHLRAAGGGGLRARVAHSVEDGRSMTRDIILVERTAKHAT